MTGYKPTAIEKAHTGLNIRKQLIAGQHRTVPNKTVMKVSKKVKPIYGTDENGEETVSFPIAFPPGDFLWWKNPRWGDDEYAILIPMADAPTYGRLQKKGRDNTPYTYEFEMEEIQVDFMMVTYCEIARFHENPGGEAAVMRVLGDPVVSFDTIMQEQTSLRAGYIDTVREAEYVDGAQEGIEIAFLPVGAGQYKDVIWRDVPEDYVRSIANGRMGAAYEAQKLMAKAELERRKNEGDGPKPVTLEIPVEQDIPEIRCEAIAASSGEQCKGKGINEVDGHYYCNAHITAAKAKTAATVGGGS